MVEMLHPSRDELRGRLRGLYGIAGPVAGATAGECRVETLELTEALLSGGARVIQLRDKVSEERDIVETARLIRARTRAAGVLFFVNDHLDIALLTEADGIHVGQQDLSVEDIRHVAMRAGRPDLLIGLSTHDLKQVKAAIDPAPDYIGFGPVYTTVTKDTGYTARGASLLREVVHLYPGPVVAIGGVTLANAREVADAGAAMAAVIGDIVRSADRVDLIRELQSFWFRSSP